MLRQTPALEAARSVSAPTSGHVVVTRHLEQIAAGDGMLGGQSGAADEADASLLAFRLAEYLNVSEDHDQRRRPKRYERRDETVGFVHLERALVRMSLHALLLFPGRVPTHVYRDVREQGGRPPDAGEHAGDA